MCCTGFVPCLFFCFLACLFCPHSLSCIFLSPFLFKSCYFCKEWITSLLIYILSCKKAFEKSLKLWLLFLFFFTYPCNKPFPFYQTECLLLWTFTAYLLNLLIRNEYCFVFFLSVCVHACMLVPPHSHTILISMCAIGWWYSNMMIWDYHLVPRWWVYTCSLLYLLHYDEVCESLGCCCSNIMIWDYYLVPCWWVYMCSLLSLLHYDEVC